MLLDEVTTLVERGHDLEYVKSMDLISFLSLSESSDRVFKERARFQARQQIISAQGTVKAFKELMKELETKYPDPDPDPDPASKEDK